MENWSEILETLPFDVPDVDVEKRERGLRLLEMSYDVSIHAARVVDALWTLCGGPVSPRLRPVFRHPRHGEVLYDWSAVEEIVASRIRRQSGDEGFDADAYLAIHRDLSEDAELSRASAKRHFAEVGWMRRSSSRQDWKLLVSFRPELLLQHFVDSADRCLPFWNSDNDGLRRTMTTFDLDSYKENNPDLSALSDEECRCHWKRHGSWEGRWGSVLTLDPTEV